MKQYSINRNNQVTQIGSGKRLTNDGCKMTAGFVQPFGLCSEGNTLYVTDAASGKIKMVTPVHGTVTMLENLGKIYTTFGVHLKGQQQVESDLHDSCAKTHDMMDFIESHVNSAKTIQNIPQQLNCNGPQGTISHKTQVSVGLLNRGLEKCQNLMVICPVQVL